MANYRVDVSEPAEKDLRDIVRYISAQLSAPMTALKMMDKVPMDAVVVATPNKFHEPLTIAALERGLHVFCEKPLVRKIAEARELIELAPQCKVATQHGTQGGSSKAFRRSIEIIQAGLLGQVRQVHICRRPPGAGCELAVFIDFQLADRAQYALEFALWQPDTAALYGLQDVSGVANPLLLRSMRDFQQSTGGRGTRRYDLLNVKYVLVRAGTPLPEGKYVRVLGPVGELEVYENQDFIPRAWWAPADADLTNLEPPAEPLAVRGSSGPHLLAPTRRAG